MLPYFFLEKDFIEREVIQLPTDISKHIIAVLRKKKGDQVVLVNGFGGIAKVEIEQEDKHKAIVKVFNVQKESARTNKLVMAIGFTKNRNRNEWFLEKLVEIGVDVIIPLQCMNSEREKLNYERMNQILEAAMIQSQRTFRPEITASMTPKNAISYFNNQFTGESFIAHCENDIKVPIGRILNPGNSLILIGPEGDFSPKEIEECKMLGAKPVVLGPARLRTETAVIYASTIFNQLNYAE